MKSFKSIVEKSFKNVKKDILNFKQNMDEWLEYLNGNQKDLKLRILELEERIRTLENQILVRKY